MSLFYMDITFSDHVTIPLLRVGYSIHVQTDVVILLISSNI